MWSPYDVLEVARDAEAPHIRRQYLRLALKHHPDRNPGELTEAAAASFRRVRLAYEVLRCPQRRALYDETGVLDAEEAEGEEAAEEEDPGAWTVETLREMLRGLGVSVEGPEEVARIHRDVSFAADMRQRPALALAAPEVVRRALEANVSELDLSGRRSDMVAALEALGAFGPRLRRLTITGHGLVALPDALAELTGLESLRADRNAFKSIPDVIFSLGALRELNLQQNQVDAVEASQLLGLPNLERLVLFGNRIRTLDPVIVRHPRLKHLDLECNPLKAGEPRFGAADFAAQPFCLVVSGSMPIGGFKKELEKEFEKEFEKESKKGFEKKPERKSRRRKIAAVSRSRTRRKTA